MINPIEEAFQEAVNARATQLRAEIDRQAAVLRERELQREHTIAGATAAFLAAFQTADQNPIDQEES